MEKPIFIEIDVDVTKKVQILNYFSLLTTEKVVKLTIN